MREIEFRIKDCKGKWHYGYPVFFDDGSFDFFVNEKLNELLPYEDCRVECALNNTLGQYTGLKDKNGKKIFEGDIIKIRKSTDFYGKPITFKGVVFFNEDECGFTIGKNGMKGYCISSLASYIFKSSAIEIIGNFYDNPELLEE